MVFFSPLVPAVPTQQGLLQASGYYSSIKEEGPKWTDLSSKVYKYKKWPPLENG